MGKKPPPPSTPKAIIIDDAYGLPTSDNLREHLPALRSYLKRSEKAKAWFDETFGLSGKASVRSYFDPLLSCPNRTR